MRHKRIAGDKPRKVVPTSCGRCAGSGLYSQRHGQCYRCGGTGKDPSYKAWGYPAAWTDAQCEAAHNAREKKNEAARARRVAMVIVHHHARTPHPIAAHAAAAPAPRATLE